MNAEKLRAALETPLPDGGACPCGQTADILWGRITDTRPQTKRRNFLDKEIIRGVRQCVKEGLAFAMYLRWDGSNNDHAAVYVYDPQEACFQTVQSFHKFGGKVKLPARRDAIPVQSFLPALAKSSSDFKASSALESNKLFVDGFRALVPWVQHDQTLQAIYNARAMERTANVRCRVEVVGIIVLR